MPHTYERHIDDIFLAIMRAINNIHAGGDEFQTRSEVGMPSRLEIRFE